MKIAVSATGRRLDAELDSHFGRCACFLVVETNDMTFEVLENAGESLAGGAGIQAGRRLAQQGCRVVLTGSCGPNAHRTLTEAGIDVVVGCSGSVAEAVQRYVSGEPSAAPEPDVTSHGGVERRKRSTPAPETSS